MQLSPAKPEYDSGAKAEVVLPVVVAVWEFRQEVLGLKGTNPEMLGHIKIEASSRRHPERG
jgi:hypothetical protein